MNYVSLFSALSKFFPWHQRAGGGGCSRFHKRRVWPWGCWSRLLCGGGWGGSLKNLKVWHMLFILVGSIVHSIRKVMLISTLGMFCEDDKTWGMRQGCTPTTEILAHQIWKSADIAFNWISWKVPVKIGRFGKPGDDSRIHQPLIWSSLYDGNNEVIFKRYVII